MATAFHESAIFPTDISDGSVGGPMFMTFVQGVQSGAEQRVSVWPYGRHVYDVQYGAKRADQIEALLKFFHARRGKAFGFRYRDPLDHKTCDVGDAVANNDQVLIASAVGGETTLPLLKTYSEGGEDTVRPITKPKSGTVLIAINTVQQTETTHYTINYSTGIVTFLSALTATDLVTWGGEFHVPCRFDTDRLPLRLQGPLVGDTRVPVIEVRV